MAIIYSYQEQTQPAFEDLLLGTDVSASGKPTKSFSIQSIVDLVQTGVPGGGTVTSVGANSSTFVTLSGGPITTSGIISASLSATGTPSATTYLRGDNTWAAISSSINTTYTVTSAQNGSSANIRLTGSDTSQTLVTLTPGANISLTDNGSNRITIGVTNLQLGSVTSVTTGGGLYIISGSATVNPVLGIDLTGLNNYIKFGENQTTAINTDFIAFNQDSSENVKTTTLGSLPINALTNVKSYIDAGDVGDIRNDTDTFTTTAVVNNVVSLTSAEYAALTPNANTLYIIVGAATSYTNTLAYTNNISGTEYTTGGDQVGATRSGVTGASYAFNTSVIPNSGFYFSSGPTITNASGIFGTADETVYTILGGTVSEIVEPPITATLALSLSPSLGTNGTQYTLGGNLAGATQSGPSPLTYSFNTTISPNSGYEFTSGPAITNANGTITGSQSVITTIAGTIEAVAPPPVTVIPSLINNFTENGFQNQVSLSVTPGSFSGDSPVAYSFTPSATANQNYTIQNLSFTGDISGSANTTKTAIMQANGTIVEDVVGAVVELIVSNQITGGAEGTAYTRSGNNTGDQQSGAVPFVYGFSTTVTPLPNYEFTSLNITNASGTTNQTGLQYVTTTITGNVQAAPEPVCATLNVLKNITGEQVYSITGNDTGAQQCGAQPFSYSFSTGVSIPSGYEWTSGPTISPNPNSGTISVDTTVTTTVSGNIAAVPGDCVEYSIFANSGNVFSVNYINCDGNPSSINVPGGDEAPICSTVFPTVTAGSGTITPTGLDNCSPPEQYTVTLAFSNNVTGFANTTTSLTPGASITGNAGDAYQFVHTITANSGYAFTSGPTWVDNVSNNGTGTINGTIPNSNTTITQSVSGVVESSATCTSFAAGPNSNFSGVCEAIGLNTYYHDGTSSYPIVGDTVYSAAGCSTFLAAGYYLMSDGNYIRVVGGGEVIEVETCP